MDVSEPVQPRFVVGWYGRTSNAGAIAEAAARLSNDAASTTAGGTDIRLLMALSIQDPR